MARDACVVRAREAVVRTDERDADAAAAICGGEVRMILSFGYPARPRDPSSRPAEEWSERAKRRPLDELVRKA